MKSMLQVLCASAVCLAISPVFLGSHEKTPCVSVPQHVATPVTSPAPAATTVLVPPSILHNWLTTAYSYREAGHKAFGHLNSMGHSLNMLVEGCRQIAADWSFLPRGSVVVIPKIGRCIVTDCGSAVKGRHVDIHFDNLPDMKERGSQIADIQVLRWGWAGSQNLASNP